MGRIEELGDMIARKFAPYGWEFVHQRWKRFLSKQGVRKSITCQIHSKLCIDQQNM